MRSRRVLSLGLLTLGTSLCVLAVTPDSDGPAQDSQDAENPYQGIVDRNVFALKPPPPPPDPNDAKNQAQPSKIVLQGITSILGHWQVLGHVQRQAKPPEQAKDVSFVLSVGQRDGDIEVVSIDGKSGTVKVLNCGTEQVLTMEKDGAKPPAGGGPPAPGAPGAGARPGGVPVVGAQPQTAAAAMPTTSAFPSRTMRTGRSMGVMTSGGNEPVATAGATIDPNQPNVGYANYGNSVSFGNANPNAAVNANPAANTAALQAAAQRSVEENVVLYEANRLRNEELARAGLRPRMPRHSYLGEDASGQPQTPVQNAQPQIVR